MFISLARQLSNIDRHLCHQSNLGNIWVRSTPGLPGRLEAGQRSSAGFVQANLNFVFVFVFVLQKSALLNVQRADLL